MKKIVLISKNLYNIIIIYIPIFMKNVREICWQICGWEYGMLMLIFKRVLDGGAYTFFVEF